MKISHYQIQSQEKQDFNILTVIFNPPTAFFFFFFFLETCWLLLKKSFQIDLVSVATSLPQV